MTPIIIALLILAIGAAVLIVADIFTAKLLQKRKEGMDKRRDAITRREGKLDSREIQLDRLEADIAEREKQIPQEGRWERFKDALIGLFADEFHVPEFVLYRGLSKEQEAAFERNFNPPKGSDGATDGVKRGPICLCTAKVEPGDGVLDDSIVCDLHKDGLERIPGFNGAVRHHANEIAVSFLSFIGELWENGNRIKEANLYVIFTESEQNGGGGDGTL